MPCLTCSDIDWTLESVLLVLFSSQWGAAHLFETHYLHTLFVLHGCLESNMWAYGAEGVLKQYKTLLCAEVVVWCRCHWTLVLLCLEFSQVFSLWGSRFAPSTLRIGMNWPGGKQPSQEHGLMKPLACDDDDVEGALVMAVCFLLGNWKYVAAMTGAMFSG